MSEHTVRERCISHGMEWDVYVQLRGESTARIVLEPNGLNGIENGINWPINPGMAESLLEYGSDEGEA